MRRRPQRELASSACCESRLRDALTRYDKGGTGFAQAALQLKAAIPTDRLLADVLAAALTRAFLSDDPLPATERAFAEQVKRARARLPAVIEGAFRLLTIIANEYQALTQRIAAAAGGTARLAAEVRAQRDALVYPGFFAATPWAQLEHLPRYMKALDRRLAKFAERPERDARHAEQVAELWRRYRDRADRNRQAGQYGAPARGLSMAAGGAAGVAVRPGIENPVPGLVQTRRKGVGGPCPVTGVATLALAPGGGRATVTSRYSCLRASKTMT